MTTTLHPVHPSIGRPLKPLGFSSLPMSTEQREGLDRLALETFASMANCGHGFTACLSALLLTGMQWGQAIARERDMKIEIMEKREVTFRDLAQGETFRFPDKPDGVWIRTSQPLNLPNATCLTDGNVLKVSAAHVVERVTTRLQVWL